MATKKKEAASPMPMVISGDQRYMSKKRRMDGLYSALTGVGNGKAKQTYFMDGFVMSAEELTSMYEYNWLAAKVIDKPVDDACEPDIEITADKDKGDLSDHLRSRWYELDCIEAIKTAMKWARLYGGGALLIVVEERKATDLWRPLLPANIKRIIELKPCDCNELQPNTYYNDPTKANYGKPRTYTYSPVGIGVSMPTVSVHESRIIRFDGIKRPSRSRVANAYNQWGIPILQRIYDEIQGYAIFEDCVIELSQDLVTRSFKMTGLADLVAANEDSVIQRRVECLSRNLTPHKTLVMDSTEEVSKDGTPLTGFSDIATFEADLVAGSSGIPRAVLFSQQEGTLAAAGETKDNYRDMTKAMQTGVTKHIDRIFEMLILEDECPNCTSDDYEWEWNSLTTKDDQKEANARQTQANIDKLYIDLGVLGPDEVRASRFGTPEFSFATVVETPDELPEAPNNKPVVPPTPPQLGPDGQPLPPQSAQPPVDEAGLTKNEQGKEKEKGEAK